MGLLSWLKRRFKKESAGSAVVELPDIPSEYLYIQRLTCRKCRGATSGKRTGSGSGTNNRMLDFWTVTCTKCGLVQNVTLSVPGFGGLSQGQVQDVLSQAQEKLGKGGSSSR